MNGCMNILLVDDSDLDAMVFQRTLRKFDSDAVVVHAHDGCEALDIVNAEHAEKKVEQTYFILLDINMPRMNGHEFLEALRSRSRAKTAIVFMFSTSSSFPDIDRSYCAGANGYITKPSGTASMKGVLQALQGFWNVCEPPVFSA